MIAVEYHCRTCKRGHNGRFFKAPDAADVAKGAEAEAQWRATIPRFVPDEAILAGDETSRLLRWGYTHWRDLFLPRQLLGLETSAAFIADLPAGPVREALATNLSDLVRYQNLLCRYDTRTLKVLDTFSVHGFPVGLVQAEANLLGVPSEGGGNVGSGGWSKIVEKYTKAKTYCKAPFEVREEGGRRVRVFIPGERIGAHEAHIGDEAVHRAGLFCRDAAHAEYASASIDAVLTDPPYLGNVQYAELIDFCYVWLRRLVGPDVPGFAAPSTRRLEELTANATQGRGLVSFTGGLSRAFRKAALGLKPGGPFVFTYHHNAQEAYVPVAVALLDAGLVCTACLPCPGEMAASLHIRGTASSTVDTVFVCRSCESTLGESHLLSLQSPTEEAARDADRLRQAGMELTPGDLRCLRFGHLTRLAVRHLIAAWDCSASVERRLASVQDWMARRLSTGSSGGKRMESGAESHEAPTDQGVGSEACVSGTEAA